MLARFSRLGGIGRRSFHQNPFIPGLMLTEAQRKQQKMEGLLPPAIFSLEQSTQRVMTMLRRIPSPLDKFVFMMNLQCTNENLFFHVLSENINECMPIVYTPTVGEGCQQMSLVWNFPMGMYITMKDKGNIQRIVDNWKNDVEAVVVTDGERILGLGDLGANGVGIAVGKLNLYVACGGANPRKCLPIMLDVGTNNPEFIKDPYYIGTKAPRVRGAEYDALVDELMAALTRRWPEVLIQFEDFGNENAFRLLSNYRNKICTFNDDIQGTASVVVAGLISACKIKKTRFRDEKFLFLGAGEAGTGIADLIVLRMMKEGCPEEEARRRCWLIDSKGLVTKARSNLAHHKIPYAHEHSPVAGLENIIDTIKPTGLIGVSTQGGSFTHDAIRKMAKLNEHPIIFPLSNPTSCSECTAAEAFSLTNGKVLFASGSPFDMVKVGGKLYRPGQGNNVYIFPGVGLGAICSRAKHITDEMFLIAADTVASCVQSEDIALGCLYPDISKIRDVSAKIAVNVAKYAMQSGLARAQLDESKLDDIIRSRMFKPREHL